MLREMRRKNQALTNTEILEILERNTSGVLAVVLENGYPYTVPLSYVHHDNKLYFHCAKSGLKIDAIKENPNVSFCIIDQDDVVPEKYTTFFRSVIAFGKAKIIVDELNKLQTLQLLGRKYNPNNEESLKMEINKDLANVLMIQIDIEHITGKEAIELKRMK